MAKINLAADNIQVRASSIEENRAILREIQTKKEVDARKQGELSTLFDDINAECYVSKSLREKNRISSSTLTSSFDQVEDKLKPIHYGPLPGCLPGKWWPIRVDCSKDCMHKPVDEKIHDGPYGAASICTPSLNLQNDVDLGHVLTFTGREYSLTNECTDSLVLSYKNRVPVRLVRGSCLSNKYAPRTGYRYDGLYTVIRHWIGVSSADTRRYHKFVLSRVLNQEPPPWVDKKVHLKTASLKKSSLRLTRSSDSSASERAKELVCSKVEKHSKPSNVITIVSRQVFDKNTSGSPDSTANSRSTKLCSTNLSIRTNLYDSSPQAQDVKKTVTSVCKIFKPNRFVQVSKAVGASPMRQIESDPSARAQDKSAKKVSWADACNAGLIGMEKTVPRAGNGYQYGALDGPAPSSRKKSRLAEYQSASGTCDHASSQGHSKRNNLLSQKASAVHEMLQHETEKSSESTSIDSLEPEELVSVIVKEKYHPMAKLLIGNMIGLENREDALVNAYKALIRVNPDDSKQYKLRNTFSIKSPSKKNGILKKQRREIANLTIDAKFDTRSSRSRGLGATGKRTLKSDSNRRKLLSTRRIESRNKGIAASREKSSRIVEKGKKLEHTVKKVNKTVTVWTQCSLLAVPTVDQCQDTEDLEPVKFEDKPSEACSNPLSLARSDPATSNSPTLQVHACSSYPGSAFAAVSADSNDRIARLRSIGFRPIGCDSPTQDLQSAGLSSRQDVDQEYNKYTSEENDVVGYMDEQLHFEDIEEEEEEEKMSVEEDEPSLRAAHSLNILPQPIETLTEHDFKNPWHGWRKISINGQTYWTGR